MYIGQRIAIPGAILSSILLCIFLWAVSAGAAFPTQAHAAASAPAVTPAPDTGSAPSESQTDVNGDPLIDVVDGNALAGETVAPTGECLVSQAFPANVLQWCSLISEYAVARSLPADLVAAVMLQESGGDPNAYSHSGAVGLLQVMPRDGLAASFMCKNGPCFSNRPSSDELYDPEFNIRYGTKMLANLHARFGNLRDALKSYGPMDVGYYYADLVLGIYQNYSQE